MRRRMKENVTGRLGTEKITTIGLLLFAWISEREKKKAEKICTFRKNWHLIYFRWAFAGLKIEVYVADFATNSSAYVWV